MATQNSGQTNPIIFFGTEDFSAASLQALIDADFTIAAVVTKKDSKKGRGRTLIPPIVKTIALKHNIPVWQPDTLGEITESITTLQPVTGVLVSFGKIIPQSTIDLFTPGIINVHPSRLPRYRGPSPIESAILNGDAETGVSIMQLSKAMDAGPVYHFTPRQLSGTETQTELYDTLGALGARTLVSTLPAILSGDLAPVPQDESHATYCALINKPDGVINWHTPAVHIERAIRAYSGWPGSKTILGGVDVVITGAEVVEAPTLHTPGTVEVHGNELTVYASAGALAITTLKPAGKKEMNVKEFLNGHRHLFA